VNEYSHSEDHTGYCQLASVLADALMERCREHFSLTQLAGLRRFVDGHWDGCGVMTLVKRSAVALESCAQ
jgi:hypothetical protein